MTSRDTVDAPTWEQLVREHSDQVFRLAYRLTGNRQDAEDLTQDVFVKVFRSLHSFKSGTMSGWLHRITTNLYIDAARRRSRLRIDALSHVPDYVWGESSGPGELHDEAELEHDVAAALESLKPQIRVAIVLRDIEGLSCEEIASVLDVRLATVRSRIQRGRVQLREALAHRQPNGSRERYLGVHA